MSISTQNIIADLGGQLVVSCQAAAGSPLVPTAHIVAIAQTVVMGGAKALRIEGVENVRAVRAAVDVPVIGIVKADHPGFEAFITAQIEEVVGLADAGAEIIAFDATDRSRPVPVRTIIDAIRECGCAAMADISTIDEARAAIEAGAHVAGTTLSGYTGYSRAIEGPDFELMSELAAARLPFVAEGRIWSPAEAAHCIALGAQFVVVGSAITRPDEITRRYADAVVSASTQRIGEFI